MAAGCRDASGNNPESIAVVSNPVRWLRAIKIAGLWKSLTENYAEEYINPQELLVHARGKAASRFFLRVAPKGSGIDFRENVATAPVRFLVSLRRQSSRKRSSLLIIKI